MKKLKRHDAMEPEDLKEFETPNGKESMTQQQFKDDNNAELLVKQYLRTGILPNNFSMKIPSYGDTTTLPDYDKALQVVTDAKQKFEQLPADIRFRFNNDPSKFLAFVNNPANLEEGAKIGLWKIVSTEKKQEDKTPPSAPAASS